MGTTFVVLGLYFLRVIFLFAILLPLYKYRYSPAIKFFKKEFRNLFFNIFMAGSFEVYFELLFIGMITRYTTEENKYNT